MKNEILVVTCAGWSKYNHSLTKPLLPWYSEIHYFYILRSFSFVLELFFYFWRKMLCCSGCIFTQGNSEVSSNVWSKFWRLWRSFYYTWTNRFFNNFLSLETFEVDFLKSVFLNLPTLKRSTKASFSLIDFNFTSTMQTSVKNSVVPIQNLKKKLDKSYADRITRIPIMYPTWYLYVLKWYPNIILCWVMWVK